MYMSKKNQSNLNQANIDANTHSFHLQTKLAGASWVQDKGFWLMGTITFYEQRKGAVFEDKRQKLMRYLFNATDRNLLPRKYTHTDLKKEKTLKERYNKQQVRQRHIATMRLERVVMTNLAVCVIFHTLTFLSKAQLGTTNEG